MVSNQNLKIHFHYSRLFDLELDKKSGNFSRETVNLLLEKVSSFQSDWDLNGTRLCEKLELMTSKRFFNRELIVSLFLDESFPNMSLPFLFNVKFLIEKDTPENRTIFIGLIFHELLHYFIVDNKIMNSSQFLIEQGELPRLTQNHIHLFALEKLVYEELGLDKELNIIRQREEQESGQNAKAWQIVDRYYEVIKSELLA